MFGLTGSGTPSAPHDVALEVFVPPGSRTITHTRHDPRTHTCTTILYGFFLLLFSFLKNKNKTLHLERNSFSGQSVGHLDGQNTRRACLPSVTLHSTHTSAHCAHAGTILQSSAGTSADKRVTRRRGMGTVRIRPLQVPEQDWAGTGRRSQAPSLSLRTVARPPARRPHGRRDQLAGVKAAARKTAGMRPSRSPQLPPLPQVSTRACHRLRFLSGSCAYPGRKGGRKEGSDDEPPSSFLLLHPPFPLPYGEMECASRAIKPHQADLMLLIHRKPALLTAQTEVPAQRMRDTCP